MANFRPKIEMYFFHFDVLNWKSIQNSSNCYWPIQILLAYLLGKKNHSFWTLKQKNGHCATGGG